MLFLQGFSILFLIYIDINVGYYECVKRYGVKHGRDAHPAFFQVEDGVNLFERVGAFCKNILKIIPTIECFSIQNCPQN